MKADSPKAQGDAIMEQIMTHNINKELIIYGVYSTMYDMWNGSDVLCSARKRFFETGAAQKKRSSIKINDSTYNYSYTLESGSALKYRRTKGARQAERVIEIPDGYAVEQYDDMRRPVKRVFYSLRHIWLRTEYLNEIDGSVNMMIAAGADAEKQALILKVGSRSEILIPFDVSLDKELTNKLNILTSEPKVFCVTNCGSFYFCSEDEYEARMKALNRLVSEQKAETDTEPVSDEQFDGSDFVIDTDLLEGDGSGFDLRSSEEICIDEPESDTDDNAEEYTEPVPAWLTEANPGSENNEAPETAPVLAESEQEIEEAPETAPVLAESEQEIEEAPETAPVQAISEQESEEAPETEPVQAISEQESEETTETEPVQAESEQYNDEAQETAPVQSESGQESEETPETVPVLAESEQENEETPETAPVLAESEQESEEAAELVEDAIFTTEQKSPDGLYGRSCAFADDCPFEAVDKKCIESGDKRYYYFGEMKDNKRSGKGRTIMSNGETAYEGDYLDDKRDGFGVYYYRSGKLCYVGGWKENDREGLGAAFSPSDDSVVVGRWSGDRSVEVVSHFDSSGRLLYTGSVSDGKKNGAGMTYNPADKTFFVGKFKDGVFLEKGTQFSAEGDLIYTGGYRNNVRFGQGILYRTDGTVKYKGGWYNNKYDGEGTLYYEDGSTVSGTFRSGRAHGKCTLTGKDGRVIYSGGFADDAYNGTGRLFFSDGCYAEGRFADGEPVGIFSEYNSEKELVYSGDWTNKLKSGAAIEYSDPPSLGRCGHGKLFEKDSLVYIGTFNEGKREGFGVEYLNGAQRYKGMWKNDSYSGYGILYVNNEAKFVGSFSDGMMNGRINEIADHAVIRKSLYKNNELTYTCEYSKNGGLVYYGGISDNMRSGMGCIFLPDAEKQFEGIFRSNEPDKPMKVLFKELTELPNCPELNNTEYEIYRKTPEYIIEKKISAGGTEGIYTGRLRNGVPNGGGTMLYSDHRYTGVFSEGKPEGEGIVYMRDGEEYKGFFSVRPFPDCNTLILADITYYYKEMN